MVGLARNRIATEKNQVRMLWNLLMRFEEHPHSLGCVRITKKDWE